MAKWFLISKKTFKDSLCVFECENGAPILHPYPTPRGHDFNKLEYYCPSPMGDNSKTVKIH
jgi:hypothetical protein